MEADIEENLVALEVDPPRAIVALGGSSQVLDCTAAVGDIVARSSLLGVPDRFVDSIVEVDRQNM